MATLDEMKQAIANAAGRKPILAGKDLTTPEDFHQGLADSVKQRAADRQNMVESLPYKYDVGHHVFTAGSAQRNQPPFKIVKRTLVGNMPMRHPTGPVMKDEFGKTVRTPYAPGYTVRQEHGDGRYSQYDLPEHAIAGHLKEGGAVHMAGGSMEDPDEELGSARVQAAKANLNPARQTVRDPQRMAFPGIYDRPDVIAKEAASRVAPESPALKQLFGVTREDLYQMGKGRQGNLPGTLPGAAKKPKGSEAAARVMNPRNEQRIMDVMGEAEKHHPLVQGMDPWYIMDPMYQRLKQIVGPEEAARHYDRLNHLMGMSSPGSEVNTEIPRGSAANYLQEHGRFADFMKYAGMAENKRTKRFPKDIRNVPGHAYHKTAQAGPMEQYLTAGEIQMKSPKVPMYIQASGVPETGFQTATPVGDAHWSRAVGLADTRNWRNVKGQQAIPGASVSTPEMSTLKDWWRDSIAKQMGLESVPAQARAWGAFSGQTGVTTPIGAPKLELIAMHIMETAKRLGITPEAARDMVLQGKAYAGKAEGGSIKAEPDLDEMRLANTLRKPKKKALDIRSVGVDEAPDMAVKTYVSPGLGKATTLPIGGVDFAPMMPGQQLAPGAGTPGQPQPPQQGGPGGPPAGPSGSVVPMGGLPPGEAPVGQSAQAPQSNILAMTRQGQALRALTPVLPPPMKKAVGGAVGSRNFQDGGKVAKRPEVRATVKDENLQRKVPEMEAAAKALQEGVINRREYDRVVKKHKPVKPYDFVPQPASNEDAERALMVNKKAQWRGAEQWPAGRKVGLRLDIPAYEHHGVWVNSIHDEEGGEGEKLKTSYGPVSSVKNATFDASPSKAMRVATGEQNKSPFARIKGELHHMTEDEAVKHIQENLHHPDYAQVGMDPRRHGYFYDRKTLKPITHSAHVVQIGPLVLAHKPTYGTRETYKAGGVAHMAGGSVEQMSAEMREKGKQSDFFPEDFSSRKTRVAPGQGNLDSVGHPITGTHQGLQKFWNWFGGSHAVDKANKPLRLYHSTNSDVSTFKANQPSSNNYGFLGNVPTTRAATFLTPNRKFSQEYLRESEGQNVMPVHAAIKKPFDMRKGLTDKQWDELEKAGVNPRAVHNTTPWELFDNDDNNQNHFVDTLKRLGYDSAIFHEDSPNDVSGTQTTYATFHPHQIKSAIGNRGTYDPANPDITKKSGGKVTLPASKEQMERELKRASHFKQKV